MQAFDLVLVVAAAVAIGMTLAAGFVGIACLASAAALLTLKVAAR